MTDNEVNKIIAEYMGLNGDAINNIIQINKSMIKKYAEIPHNLYTESLDALVPVWEKLREENCGTEAYEFNSHNDGYRFNFDLGLFETYRDCGADGETLQQAAAHATAKAIQELNKGGE